MDYPWNHHPPPPPPPGNPNLFPSPQIPHYQNPSFQSPATYSHHRPQIPYNQNPNLDNRGYHYGVAYSPFDLGYERPRPDEFGVAADQNPCFQSPIAYNQNPNLDYRNYNGDVPYPPFDHGYKRAREDDLGLGNNYNPTFHKPQIARNQSPNLEYSNYNDGAGYSPFDHGYERPRPNELSVGDNERRLKLIRDHGGTESMSVNGEIRKDFPESSGLKRPRFDELGVGKSYTATNMNTHDEINGYHDKNYEQRLVRNDSLTLSHDIRSNLPPNYGIHSHGHFNESAFGHNVLPTSSQVSTQSSLIFENNSNIGVAPGSNIQPSRPVAPPTPFRMDPQGPLFLDQHTPSSQAKVSSLFPISVTPTAPKDMLQFPQTFAKEFQPVTQRLCMNYPSEGQHFPLIPSNKPKAVDASHIFKQPHRATRPDYIVVILRGLPGSGKSYLAKMMRDLEVDNGGKAPRIHSMDDYFMTEVEKVEESDNLKSSGSSRGKKSVVKMVMEFCYEAEMEESLQFNIREQGLLKSVRWQLPSVNRVDAYRSSMLKTFKKTLDEGAFPLVIVDDRNLRVADFAQFWATAKRSGYEVYLLEAMYKDPAGCAARNVHGFTLDDIQKMADQWEEAPSLYLKLDAKSLLNGDDLKENDIQEVDMDTEDGPSEDALSASAERNSDNLAPTTNQLSASGPSKANDHWNADSDHIREEVKELGRSKWSNDLDDDNSNNKEASAVNPSVSAIVKAKTKEGKSVHWGDQGANVGFSIGAVKRVNTSLVIGAGSGYNSKSNPLPEDVVSPGSGGKSNHQSVFQERIRAEHESFRAVFDKRRHRIGGLDLDEE